MSKSDQRKNEPPASRLERYNESPTSELPTNLNDRMRILEQELWQLRREFEEHLIISQGEAEVISVDTTGVELSNAEEMISAYLREHGKAYPSDISLKLGLPLKLVVDFLEKLRIEGHAKVTGE